MYPRRGLKMCSLAKLPDKCGDENEVSLSEDLKPRDFMHGYTVLVWLVASSFVLIEVDLKDNVTGVTVSMSMVQVFLMLLSTIMMTKGLKDGCWLFIVPWVLISSCHCYSSQFKDILEIYNEFLARDVAYFPWFTLGCYGLTLALRIYIILIVILLSMQQWYNQQLLKELVVSA